MTYGVILERYPSSAISSRRQVQRCHSQACDIRTIGKGVIMQTSVGLLQDQDPDDSGAPAAPLSTRQIECLVWAQEGKSARDIGGIIGISGRTVEKHLARACSALDVRTRLQAILRARDLGLIPRRRVRG
jgi:DNA-binding CsgD family transcriptional regulator